MSPSKWFHLIFKLTSLLTATFLSSDYCLWKRIMHDYLFECNRSNRGAYRDMEITSFLQNILQNECRLIKSTQTSYSNHSKALTERLDLSYCSHFIFDRLCRSSIVDGNPLIAIFFSLRRSFITRTWNRVLCFLTTKVIGRRNFFFKS